MCGRALRSNWLQTLRERDAARDADNAAKAAAPAESFLNPMQVAQALDQCLEPGAIIVADGGDFVGTASYIVRPDGPLTWLE